MASTHSRTVKVPPVAQKVCVHASARLYTLCGYGITVSLRRLDPHRGAHGDLRGDRLRAGSTAPVRRPCPSYVRRARGVAWRARGVACVFPWQNVSFSLRYNTSG